MNKTILVYDDEEGILEVIKIILEENGYTVYTFTNGKSILNDVKKYKPNLLLLDIWMKGMNGDEIARQLKMNEATKKCPFILISALNETEAIATKVKANGFLKKPFEMDALLEMVKQKIG